MNRSTTAENRKLTMDFIDSQPAPVRLLIYEYGVAAYMRAKTKGGDVVANLKAERARRQAGLLTSKE